MIKLAWRNIWRNSRRTLITVASIFSAVLFCVLCESLAFGSWNRLIDNILRSQAGHVEIHGKEYLENRNMDYFLTMKASTIEKIKELPEVANVAPRLETFAMASSEETAKGVAVVGIDPVEENLKSSLSERVIKGEYLRPDDDGVIVGKRLSEFLQIEVGDTLALMGQGYHGSNAIGLFPVRGIADLMFPEVDNGALYMSIPAAQYFVNMPDGYSGLLVAANEGADLTGLCQRISTLVDTASVEVLPWQIVMEDLVIQSQANDVFRQIIKFILYAIVGFGILGTVIMMTNERKHEFGVLVALGMKRGKLSRVVCIELAFMAFIGVAAAIAISLPITYYFEVNPIHIGGELERITEGYGFKPELPMIVLPSIYINQAVIILLITCVVTLYPMHKISKLKINKAIR